MPRVSKAIIRIIIGAGSLPVAGSTLGNVVVVVVGPRKTDGVGLHGCDRCAACWGAVTLAVLVSWPGVISALGDGVVAGAGHRRGPAARVVAGQVTVGILGSLTTIALIVVLPVLVTRNV